MNGNRTLSPPVIVCAAIRNSEGLIIPGPRHFDQIMHRVMDQLKPQALKYRWEQGFIDQHGVFYSREQAWEIAEFHHQIVRELPVTGKLYSEHLY
jgi:hypothetical protein